MSGVLPAALLCAALGFAMSAAAPRTQAATLTTLVVAASVGSFAPPSNLVTFACWLSVIATSLAVYLPPGLGRRLLVVLAANAGVWSGAAIGPDRVGLLAALPFALLCLPAAWLVARRRQIAVQVVCSWLIAVAVLAAGLPTLSTPASAPDHME